MKEYFISYSLESERASFESLERQLASNSGGLSQIARSLGNYSGSMQALIDRTATAAADTGKLADSVGTLGSVFGDIVACYLQNEKKVYAALGGDPETDAQNNPGNSSGAHVLPYRGFLTYYRDNLLSAIVTGTAATSLEFLKDGSIADYSQLTENGLFRSETAEMFVAGAVSAHAAASLFDENGIFNPNFDAGASAEGSLIRLKNDTDLGPLHSVSQIDVITGSVASGVSGAIFSGHGFDPHLDAYANAEAAVLKGSTSARLGSEVINVHASAEGEVLSASANASTHVGMDGVSMDAGADAAVFRGEVRGGYDIFGIHINAKAEGEAIAVGAEVKGSAEWGHVAIGGKLSALLGAGVDLDITW